MTQYQLKSATGKIEKLDPNHIPLMTVGRSPHMHIQIDMEGVSRHHANLEITPEGWKLTDLGSKNGTFINDQMLEKQDAKHLTPGDQIRFNGSAVYRFEIAGLKPVELISHETCPGEIADFLRITQDDIAAVQRSVAEIRKEQAGALNEIRQEQAQAKAERRRTADEVAALNDNFERYRTMDGDRFQQVSHQLNALSKLMHRVTLAAAVSAAMALIAISASSDKDRGTLSMIVEALGGPETIGAVTFGILAATGILPNSSFSRSSQATLSNRTISQPGIGQRP